MLNMSLFHTFAVLIVFSFTHSISHAGSFTAYGPKTFVRGTGKPVAETASFNVKNTNIAYTLKIYNGGINSEYSRISSAVISLNGSTIFSESDFNQQALLLQRQVSLSSSNSLSVELKSSPNSGITIIIEGEDSEPPAVAITSPVNGIYLNTPSITVSGTTSDNGSWINGVTVNGANASLNGESFTSNIQLAEGQNTISAIATDAAGNTGSAAAEVYLDTTPPLITLETLPSTTSNPLIQIKGTVTDATPITTLSINGQNIGAVSQTSIQFSADVTLSEGLNTITIAATDSAGNTSTQTATVTLNTLKISITEPSDGATVTKSTALIRGTLKTATQDIGVTVNGVVAEINGNNWAASVPLQTGTNTIEATVTDAYENTDKQSIYINTQTTEQSVTLSTNPQSGIAPLNTTFTIDASISNTVTSYKNDFDGDGVTDQETMDVSNISHTYDMPGIYYPTVTVTDNQYNSYTETTMVNVLDKDQMDALLKGKWDGMKGAMGRGDVTETLTYFTSAANEKYSDVFTTLKDYLPSIAANMRDIDLVSVTGNVVEYRISRIEDIDGQSMEITYFIYFTKDGDGLWKIESF